MPVDAWNDQRERQYEHIKESLEDRGKSEDKAKEIAARTVNKERARLKRFFADPIEVLGAPGRNGGGHNLRRLVAVETLDEFGQGVKTGFGGLHRA